MSVTRLPPPPSKAEPLKCGKPDRGGPGEPRVLRDPGVLRDTESLQFGCKALVNSLQPHQRQRAQSLSPGPVGQILNTSVGTEQRPQLALGIMQLFSNSGEAAVTVTRATA